jgi:hypothetical protein
MFMPSPNNHEMGDMPNRDAPKYDSMKIRISWIAAAVLAALAGFLGCLAIFLLPSVREPSAAQTGSVGAALFISLLAISMGLPFLALSSWFALERVRFGRVAVAFGMGALVPGLIALFLYLQGPPGSV